MEKKSLATELRIGNLVNYANITNRVVRIEFTKFRIVPVGQLIFKDTFDIEPIPITEKWLLNLGFESSGLSGGIFVLDNVIDGTSDFVIETDGIEFYPQVDRDACCWAKFQYIHQLQNLYFALTGHELTLK